MKKTTSSENLPQVAQLQEMLEDSIEVISENNAQKDKIFRT